jgi:carbon-monoxide dehydrogenase medium subunit
MDLHAAPGTNAFLAGGIDLIDWLKFGHQIDRLIRLDGLSGMAGIAEGPDQLHIGAMATHAAIAGSTLIDRILPDLSNLWRGIANPRVRFAGTIGGNVMADRSDYDALPALMALGAQAEVAGIGRSPIHRLQKQHLLTAFVIPTPSALRLFADRSLKPAISVWIGVNAKTSQLKIAVGMAHPRPVCVTLPCDGTPADIAAAAANLLPAPVTDSRSSAAYRRRMIGVLTERLLSRSGATG